MDESGNTSNLCPGEHIEKLLLCNIIFNSKLLPVCINLHYILFKSTFRIQRNTLTIKSPFFKVHFCQGFEGGQVCAVTCLQSGRRHLWSRLCRPRFLCGEVRRFALEERWLQDGVMVEQVCEVGGTHHHIIGHNHTYLTAQFFFCVVCSVFWGWGFGFVCIASFSGT